MLRWLIPQVEARLPLWDKLWAWYDGLPRLCAIILAGVASWVLLGAILLGLYYAYRWLAALIEPLL